MQPAEHLTLPLWRLLWLGAVRTLTFAGSTDRWSNLSAAERAERRGQWPAWRRAVRPAGLLIYWPGVAWSMALGDGAGSATTVLRFVWVTLLLPIALIGVRDWFREIPPKRRPADRAEHRESRTAG